MSAAWLVIASVRRSRISQRSYLTSRFTWRAGSEFRRQRRDDRWPGGAIQHDLGHACAYSLARHRLSLTVSLLAA